jgi:hypothetical protein
MHDLELNYARQQLMTSIISPHRFQTRIGSFQIYLSPSSILHTLYPITSILKSSTMAWLGLGVFYGAVITGVPIVTGVAQGVQHQKEANAEAANQTRMIKFYMDCFCDSDEINGYTVVLKHDKVCTFYSSILRNILITTGMACAEG